MAQSLYDKYGGFATVSVLVRKFYDKVLASKSLEPYFAGVDTERLIDHQVKFLCTVLGGPNNYTGRALEAAHRHLKITPAAFAEVAAHLGSTLTEGGVEPKDVEAILGVVAGAQKDIVSAS
jgi:hemoglobin